MNLEGKVLGFDKRIMLGVAYTLVIILAAFFAGLKYEKNKLTSLEAQRNSRAALKRDILNNRKNRSGNAKMRTASDAEVPQSGPGAASVRSSNSASSDSLAK